MLFLFSGAKINLEREENYSLGNQRRIVISGSTEQVEYAKLLIKEKVEQARTSALKYGRKGDIFILPIFKGMLNGHVCLPVVGSPGEQI